MKERNDHTWVIEPRRGCEIRTESFQSTKDFGINGIIIAVGKESFQLSTRKALISWCASRAYFLSTRLVDM